MGKDKIEGIIKKAKVEIDFEKCKGCGLCVEYCPKNILGVSKKSNKKGYFPAKVINEENCIGCGNCYVMCSDAAIKIMECK